MSFYYKIAIMWMPQNSLIINEHWLGQWLGAIRRQAINWADVDPELCRHMLSPSHNEFLTMWTTMYEDNAFTPIGVRHHNSTVQPDMIFLFQFNMEISYTLSREYRVVRSRYSRLLFTNEDRLCANSRVREQSTNMTSQCQCPAFAWRHRSFVMTSQC